MAGYRRSRPRASGVARAPRRDLEHEEQKKLIEWLSLKEEKIPEFKNVYAVINGARLTMSQAKRMKQEGMKGGVPDLCLAVVRPGSLTMASDDGFTVQVDGLHNVNVRVYGSLYIEMKTPTNYPTKEQREWHDRLEAQGMKVIRRCTSWQQAALHMLEYLGWGEKGIRKSFPELYVQ